MWRAAAAGTSVVLAAIIGVVTALVTMRPSRGLWVALGVLVFVGAALQVGVTLGERRSSKGSESTSLSDKPRDVEAFGAGAVAIGGSAHGAIQTRVHGSHSSAQMPGEHDGIVASGPGSVATGGDAIGPVTTQITDGRGMPHES
jgi:hypothetical protein